MWQLILSVSKSCGKYLSTQVVFIFKSSFVVMCSNSLDCVFCLGSSVKMPSTSLINSSFFTSIFFAMYAAIESDVTSQVFGSFSSNLINFEGKNTVTMPDLAFFTVSMLSSVWLFGVKSASSRPY